MVKETSHGTQTEKSQERGKITIETVAYNLRTYKILDWEDAFRMSNWGFMGRKPPIGRVRVEILRSLQTELNAHKREYAKNQEHTVTENIGRIGDFKSISIDGMEVPFISHEVEFMIREMLDGSSMSKKNYLEHMKQRGFVDAEEVLKKNVDFLNKYFHLGLILQESKIGDEDKFSLKISETTKVKFGKQPTKE